MIRDITIGQYFPGQSAIHRMDPRTKIILSILYIVMLFVADNMWGLLLGVLFGFAAYLISRIPVSMIWKSMKPVVPIVIFTAVLNLFLSTGDPLWQWKFLKITKEGIETAVFMSVRILCLIAGTSLLTYTTSPIALTDGIERLLSPLKKIKLPVHELAMMMTIALRFIPTLIEETDKIMSAQKARGADLESGGVMQRAKALLPILIPLFVSAFRRADELALAMECRCYHGGEGRTRLKQLRFTATRTRCWSDSKYDYTETNYYSVRRDGTLGFDAVPVDGSSKIEDDLMESIEPFAMQDAIPFQTAYLAGYVADKYDVSAEDSIERANKRIRRSTEETFQQTVTGYDSVKVENSSIQLHGGKAKYALFPVWLLSTSWRGENYLFAMNGQTGRFVGDLPVDKGAARKWMLGLTAALSAASYGVMWLLWLARIL